MELERRTFAMPVEHRDVPDTGEDKLSGYAAVYNSETVIAGLFRERIAPGAFKDAVGRDDVRALFNHDPNFVIGRTKAGTLTIREDETGLWYDATTPNTTWAKDLVTSVKRGDVSQSSFAFMVTDEKWPEVRKGELPLREIRAVELFDVSPVTYPAYDTTSVAARAQARSLIAVDVPTLTVDRARTELLRRELSLRESTTTA